MTDLSGYARYAVYYAPEPGSALARLGAAWLGADPAGAPLPPAVEPPGLPRPRADLVARARRYGLHATLKAPFPLAEGASADDLAQAVERLAAAQPAAVAPGLAVMADLGFVALRPKGACPAVDALAAACVTALDALRAPLTEAETADKAKGLDAAEAAHLARWGYPFVLDRFHFHITLTGFLPSDQADAAAAALAPVFAPALEPAFRIEALSLFGDPGGGAPFRLLRRWPLTGGA